MSSLLIFDFDGVIADSETLANTVLAEVVSELGVPTTLEDAYSRYMGKRFPEVISAIEITAGKRLPNNFAENFQARTLARFRKDLATVPGAREYIDAFADIPKCIASSSSLDRLATCLDVLSLRNAFEPYVYSASMVSRGKPHPDIFLYASAKMGFAPSECIVIEDSASGVEAGVAAGMTVVGLLAASHIQACHKDHLLAAGAHHVVETFQEVTDITSEILSSTNGGHY